MKVLLMDETVRLAMATSFGKVFRITTGRTGWGEKSIFCGNLWHFWSWECSRNLDQVRYSGFKHIPPTTAC